MAVFFRLRVSVPMSTSLTSVSHVVAAEEVVFCDLGEGVALLHLGTGTYYTLNDTGSLVWEFIQAPKTLSETL